MEKNNKELYALLKMYNSDSVSDNSEIVLAPQKKKRLTKHRRRKPSSGSQQMTPQICGGRTVSLSLALSLLLCWLLTLTWLAVILNSQIQHLDITVQSDLFVEAGVGWGARALGGEGWCGRPTDRCWQGSSASSRQWVRATLGCRPIYNNVFHSSVLRYCCPVVIRKISMCVRHSCFGSVVQTFHRTA